MWHIVPVALVSHVFHGAMVAFTETLTERPAVMFIDWRMFVDLVVVCIGVATISEVPVSSFNAFVKTASFSVLVGVRWTVPIAISILVLRCRRQWLRWRSFGLESAGGRDAEGKHRGGKPFNFHRNIYLRITP